MRLSRRLLLAFAGFLVGFGVTECATAATYVVVSVGSHHFRAPPWYRTDRPAWNETNPGIGFEWKEPGDGWKSSAGFGALKDSNGERLYYLGGGFDYRFGEHLDAGLMFATMSRVHYKARWSGAADGELVHETHRRVLFAPLPRVTAYAFDRSVALSLYYLPRADKESSDSLFLQALFTF